MSTKTRTAPTTAGSRPAYTNKALRRLHELFELADEGVLELPSHVVAESDAHASLAERTAALPPEPPDIGKVLTDRLVAGESMPTEDEIAVERSHDAANRIRRQSASAAVEILQERVLSSITGDDSATDIIATSIRPALEATVAAAKAAVAALGENDANDPLRLLVAPAEVREARAALDGIAARYGRLRAVQRVLGEWDQARFDGDGHFIEMANPYEFVPRGASNNVMGRFVPPWPNDAVGRLVYLIRHGARLWCPVAAERDAAFAEANPNAPVVTGKLPAGYA